MIRVLSLEYHRDTITPEFYKAVPEKQFEFDLKMLNFANQIGPQVIVPLRKRILKFERDT